jgi:F-type H+-transporting ATPase subunit epsilon
MFIEIITPDKKLFAGEITSAKFPGSDGSFEVLNNHAPLISSLGKGQVVINEQGKKSSFEVDGGVVEVLKNKVIVLVESKA